MFDCGIQLSLPRFVGGWSFWFFHFDVQKLCGVEAATESGRILQMRTLHLIHLRILGIMVGCSLQYSSSSLDGGDANA